MNQWLRHVMGIVVIFAITIVVGFSVPLPAIAQSTPADAIATGVIDYSQVEPVIQRSPIPFRLPRILVYQNILASRGQFWGIGNLTLNGQDQATGYSVEVITSPNCVGGLVCSIAYASAEVIVPGVTPAIDQIVDSTELSRYPIQANYAPQWVRLDNGISVYLSPWVMTSSLGYAEVIWDEQAPGGFWVRYTIGLKGGDAEWLLKMANSVFE